MICGTPLSAMLASAILLCGALPTAAQQLCKPALVLKGARTSDARDLQRTWTGVLVTDASRCSTASGAFEIQFTRLKENGPDLRFTERFTWRPGQTEVSLDIWWDEWLQDYRIGTVESCPCRE